MLKFASDIMMVTQRTLILAMLRTVVRVAIVGMVALFMDNIVETPAPTKAGASVVGPGTAVAVRLDISSGPPGSMAEARLSFDPADGVRGFNLLLQFGRGQLLSATAASFGREAAFFPEVMLGEHQLNSVRDAGPGRIRVIGLAPMEATGPAEIGRLHMQVSPDAPIGATQVVTLTGEINHAATGVTTIDPVVATFRVISPNEHLYLPLIRRTQ